MEIIMKYFSGLILSIILMQSNAIAYFIGSTDVGSVDTILNSDYLGNSGTAEATFIGSELTGLGVTNYTTSKDDDVVGDWILVDGETDIFTYALDTNIDYFVIKLGNIFSVTGPSPPAIDEDDTFFYRNDFSTDYATIDLSVLVGTACLAYTNTIYYDQCKGTMIDDEKVSHITFVHVGTTTTVPEPSIIALLGLGLLGLGLARRKMK